MSLPLSLRSAPAPLVPLLETTDLLLRGPQPTDLPEGAAMHQDPAFYRFLGGKPHSEEDVWRRMLSHMGHWAMLGYGSWSIEEKASGRFVGTVGFFDVQRDLTPSIKGTPEAGWVLAPRLHGRGYASQALQAALAWADEHLPAPRTTCIIDPGNNASLRLAHKFGYHEYARALYHGEEIVLLERFQPAPL
ncbi:GNAT family N-acetyltransferase [Hymenobacter sp. DG25A]|uniref:GNAT family N-acetyltransferase n=1 Tax=Hymenobacter sp. DG25A TaxID=1385663 RepID=UPI0006BCA8C5|nr:GNAT family N-acetyltransferase [Hymenobacter sp. DG25A]ALD21353.1 acetyltransferase [Hymenobacter sp. DG25A]